MDTERGPDERVFRAHVDGGPFRSGASRRRWRLLSVSWPHAVIAIAAAPRAGGPTEYALRFELSNYPRAAPTAQPWDADRDAPLASERWPTGRARVPKVFRPDWKGGSCLYLPCDRQSIEGHDAWRTKHPEMIWDADKDITHYLKIVHELLNSSDYTGPRSPEQSPQL